MFPTIINDTPIFMLMDMYLPTRNEAVTNIQVSNSTVNQIHLANKKVKYSIWEVGASIKYGDYVRYGINIYRIESLEISTLSTISGNAPVHTSGIVTTNGISYKFIKNIYNIHIVDQEDIDVQICSTVNSGGSPTTSIIVESSTGLFEGQKVYYPGGFNNSTKHSTIQSIEDDNNITLSDTPLSTITGAEMAFVSPLPYFNLETKSYLGGISSMESFVELRSLFNNNGTSIVNTTTNHFIPKTGAPGLDAGTFESQYNAILLLRSSLEDGLNDFKVIAKLDSSQLDVERYFSDFLIEPGNLYRYILQGAVLDSNGNIIKRGNRTPDSLSENIIPDFTGSYLYGSGDVHINFMYNGKISSYKTVRKDSVIETIGGKYPFVVRNAAVGYRQFQFSGLITSASDASRSLLGLTYAELINKNGERGTNSNLINTRYEEFLQKGSLSFRGESRGNISTNLNYYLDNKNNYIIEKKYRQKIEEWLYNGEAKVFKSDTEGLMIVKITDISLEPVEELGRTLYSFSCTMTEIDEYSLESLVKHGIRKSIYSDGDLKSYKDTVNSVIQWSENIYMPLNQYFEYNGNFYFVIADGITDVNPPGEETLDINAREISIGSAIDGNKLKVVYLGKYIPGLFI